MTFSNWLQTALRGPARPRQTPASRYRDAFQADLFVDRLEERRVLAAPVNTVPGAQMVDEDTPLAFTGGDTITATDSDADLASTELTVTNGTLTVTLSGSATISAGTNGTATLTISGNETDINATLASLIYQGNQDFNGADTLTVVSTDGAAGSDTDMVAITVNAVNDAPVLANIEGAALAYTENAAATAITSTITVADVDDTNIESATIQITGNYQNGQDVLAFTNTANITGVFNAGTGTLTLTGSDTLAAYQTALRSVTYANTSDNPSTLTRTVTFTVNDGDDASNTQTRDIAITAANDAPVLANIEGAALAYTENAAATAITSTITVADVDDTMIESATIQITGNYQNGEDVLAFVNTANITGVFNAGTGTLTLTGTDTLAAYQTALRSVTYANTSDNPSTLTRTVTFTVNDGDDASNTQTRDIAVTAVNDEPTLTATGANPTFTEGDAMPAVLYTGAMVSTVEAGQEIDRLVFTVTNVTDTGFEFVRINGVNIDVTANATDTAAGTIGGDAILVDVSVAGTTATVTIKNNAGLSTAETAALVNGLAYSNTSQDPTAAMRVVTITQLRDTGSSVAPNDNLNDALAVTSTVTVGDANDEPTLSATGSNPTFTEGDALPAVLYSGTVVSTIEAGQEIDRLVLTVTNVTSSGFEFLRINGVNIDITANATDTAAGTIGGDAILVDVSLAGTTATVTIKNNAGLSSAETATLVNGLAYSNTSQDPTATAATRLVTITQLRDTGSNTPPNDNLNATLTVTSTVTIVPVNDEPTLTATAANPTFTEGDLLPAVLYTGATVSTVEAGQEIDRLVFTVTNVTDTGFEFVRINGVNINITANATDTAAGTIGGDAILVDVSVAGTTATVTIKNNAGLSTAETATLVNGLAYSNSSQDPTAAVRAVTITQLRDTGSNTPANDNLNDTLAVTSNVTVVPVNDEPTLTATAANPTFTEGDALPAVLYTGTVVSTVEAGQEIDRLVLTVTNVTDTGFEFVRINGVNINITANATDTAAGTIGGDMILVDVSLAGTTATVTIKNNAGLSTVETASLVNGLAYSNSSQDPTAAVRAVTITQLRDTGSNTVPNDNLNATLAVTSNATLVAVNDEPSLTATALNPNYTEGMAAAALYSTTAINLVEAADLVQTLTLTVSGLQNGVSEILVVDGDDVALTNGTMVTTTANGYMVSVVEAAGTATVTITRAGNITVANAQTLVNGLAYRNDSQDPLGAMRVVTLTSIQDNGGTANGGDDTGALNIASMVTVTPVNDEPTLTATGLNPTFTEGDVSPAVLYSGAVVSTIEAGQEIDRLVLTVTNVTSIGFEFLRINGVNINITANANDVAAGTIGGDAITVDVSLAGTTATVTIKNAAGLNTAETATLVNGLAYSNTSQDPTATAATRLVTITQLRDTGSNTPPNDNLNATLSVTSNVTVTPVNDQPTLTATGLDPTFTEGDMSPAVLFSGAVVSTIEAGQEIDRLVLTVTNVTSIGFELLRINGVDIDITANANDVAAGTIGGDAITVDVSLAGTTATVTIKNAAGLSDAETATLVNGLAYSNTSQDPTATAATRLVTITQLRDTGSNTPPNDNLNDMLAVTSTVTITPVNDAPTLMASRLNPLFKEGTAASVLLFTGTSVSTIEVGQEFIELVLTVTNISNPGFEFLRINDVNVDITTNGTTATGMMGGDPISVNVSIVGTTATVTISTTGGLNAAETQGLVNGLAYRNAAADPAGAFGSPLLPFVRVVTLTSLRDNGGTANGGVDTGMLAVGSTVTINQIPQIVNIDAPQVVNGKAEVTVTVFDPSSNGTIRITINWFDPFADESTPLRLARSSGRVPVNSNGIAVFFAEHQYSGTQSPLADLDQTEGGSKLFITLTANDLEETPGDGGVPAGVNGATAQEFKIDGAGTGLGGIPFELTPDTPTFTFELPIVATTPLTVETVVELIQVIEFQVGQGGQAQGGNEILLLQAIAPDGTEKGELIPLSSENEPPEKVLQRLPDIFMKLPDDHYKIYLKREDGTTRLVLNVILRRHKQVDPDEVKKSDPPAAAGKPDAKLPAAKKMDDAAKDAPAGPRLKLPNQPAGPNQPVPAPKPADRGDDSAANGQPSSMAIPVEPGGFPATRRIDPATSSAVAAVAVWTGAEGIRRWRNQMDQEMARYADAGFLERQRRLFRSRRSTANDATN